MALHGAAIGPIFSDYYLPIFSQFEVAGRGGPSWNWAACLYTLNWMIFRRMWGAALAYVAVVLCSVPLLMAVGGPVSGLTDTLAISLWGGWVSLYFAVPGIYGNQMLHAAIQKKVMHALTASKTLKEACEKLSLQAASRQRFIWLVLTNMLLIAAAAGAHLALPDFSDTDRIAPRADEIAKVAEEPYKAPTPVAVAVPAPMPLVTASAPIPIATQAELDALDAMALRYVPRRPLVVSAAAASPEVLALAVSAQAPVSARQTASPYYINVGLFANDSNARYALAKLVDAGLVSFRLAVMTSKGKLTRVRVGPFDSKAQADASVKKIRELGLDAVVIRP